ncbi:HAD family hydrolase [Umezawaea sp. NPDC059074]|uniref:HAD family hydrolase n=1 Tax=Umezawaea sp. NPDC059074 TaxID=3346716 RepID=UPI003699D3E9
MPLEVARSEDPFDVFRYAATLSEADAYHVEAALTASEVDAVALAEPAGGSHQLMRIWHGLGRRAAVTSNNSAVSIDQYLGMHALARYVDAVGGREGADPAKLKPDPSVVRRMVQALGVLPESCVLLGDSVSDVTAAARVGIKMIGLARTAAKREALLSAGALVVVATVGSVADVIHQ